MHLRAAIPIASVAHVPDRRSPFTCHQLLLSLVVHFVAWLGKCHIDTRLSMAPARESPWSLGTPGVSALQYAAAVVERADHVPFALPPCHSTAVSQRAGRRSARPSSLSRTPGPPQGGKPCLFRKSGSTPGPPRGGENLLFFRKSGSTLGPPQGRENLPF